MKYPYSTDEAWRVIRALRHKPPGYASEGDAKLLFTSATKQSEQFFRLSDQAGYETKPILLYYGLNQASRAVRAVVEQPGSDLAWEPKGHGVTCPNLDTATDLGSLLVKEARTRGSFQKLAQIIGSPTLGSAAELREVWASTPEGADVLLEGSEAVWCCTQLHASYRKGSFPPPMDGHAMVEAEETLGLDDIPLSVWQNDSTDELQRIIHERYPDLARFVLRTRRNGEPITLTSLGLRGLTFLMPADPPLHREFDDLVIGLGNGTYREFSKQMWLIPSVGGQVKPLKPIISWWVILFALSMLARYQPSGWTRILDVDTSPDASALEYVLDEAHRVCINLLAHTFEEPQDAISIRGAVDKASIERLL